MLMYKGGWPGQKKIATENKKPVTTKCSRFYMTYLNKPSVASYYIYVLGQKRSVGVNWQKIATLAMRLSYVHELIMPLLLLEGNGSPD